MRRDASPRLDPELGTEEHLLVLLDGSQEAPPGFRLGPSRLSVGAGVDDDVFLSGVGVVPGHLQMVFVDRCITLLSATHEVRLDGLAVVTFPREWLAGQVLSLSPDSHLAYGVAGSSWPNPVPWDLGVMATTADSSADTQPPWTGGDARTANTSVSLDEPFVGDGAQGHGFRSTEPLAHFDRAAYAKRRTMSRTFRIVASALALSAITVTGLAVADLSLGTREVVNPSDQAIAQSAKLLAEFLARDSGRFDGVEITHRDDGVIQLTGFVEDEDDYRMLAERVRQASAQADGNVRIDIMTPKRLVALVRDHLARYPMDSNLEVNADTVSLVVFGVEMGADIMDRLELELGRLAARLKPRRMELEFRVASPDAFINEMAMALSESAVTRDMQFTITDDGGLITGLVAAPVESEARAVLAEVKAAFEGRLPLEIDLKVDPKLNFRVVSLTIGGSQSTATLMQRGKTQTFQLGEPVFGIGELREIKTDGVVVVLGRREMFIPLLR